MKRISLEKLATCVVDARKKLGMTQMELAEATDMNRSMLSKLEKQHYMPSISQLEALCAALNLDPVSFFAEENKITEEITDTSTKKRNIAVAGTGYVGLSLAVLLAQHNHVMAVDIIPEKVDMINRKVSPIQD